MALHSFEVPVLMCQCSGFFSLFCLFRLETESGLNTVPQTVCLKKTVLYPNPCLENKNKNYFLLYGTTLKVLLFNYSTMVSGGAYIYFSSGSLYSSQKCLQVCMHVKTGWSLYYCSSLPEVIRNKSDT